MKKVSSKIVGKELNRVKIQQYESDLEKKKKQVEQLQTFLDKKLEQKKGLTSHYESGYRFALKEVKEKIDEVFKEEKCKEQ